MAGAPPVAPAVPCAEPAPRRGRFVRVWGLRVHYHSIGEGAPVLLLHGNGSLGEEILSCFPQHSGIRWIAPDRPGYGFSDALPSGHDDPLTLAAWAADLMTALGVARARVVAHSLAAGAALCLAGAKPDRVRQLVLLAPFCRPTPHRWMPVLRLSVSPVLGRVICGLILPRLVAALRTSLLRRLFAPNAVPPWFERFPLGHAAQSRALLTMAAELRQFNAAMLKAAPLLHVRVPVTALVGAQDRTADPDWHLPWLGDRVHKLDCIRLGHAGHMVHHVAPSLALRLVAGDAAARPPSGLLACRQQ